MEEEKKVEVAETAEKEKPVSAYIVRHYRNGDIEVVDAHEEGTTELSSEGIYEDIEMTAFKIFLKRVSNASAAGTLDVMNAVYKNLSDQQNNSGK